MKAWLKSAFVMLVGGYVVAGGFTVRASDQKVDDAIQAIQQAPDPSAVIGAYANGFAVDRTNPRLYEAYVSRMVDLGLPEMAYHQAQTLTTLQSNNGLAWGVVAYVDARRGQMPDAISAINLAGQFAPEDKFIQHTAGEIVAWFDFKADKTQLPQSVSAGLAKVRTLLDKRADFTKAYNTAQKAYQNQSTNSSQTVPTSTPAAPGQAEAPPAAAVAPEVANAPQVAMAPQVPPAPQGDQIAPLGYAPPVTYVTPPVQPDYYAYPADYYSPDYSGIYLDWGPSYCYDWGAGWVAPAPWCWWQPCGFWAGCGFVPFGVSFAFGNFNDFHHHYGFPHRGFDHDRFGHDSFGHGGQFGHGDHFGHGANFVGGHSSSAWHHGPHGQGAFFGIPARANASTAQWARSGLARTEPSAATATRAVAGGGQWWNRSRAGSWVASPEGTTHEISPAANRPAPASGQAGSFATSPGSRNVGSPERSWNPSSSTYRSGTFAGHGYSAPSYNRSAPSYRGSSTYAQTYRSAPSFAPSRMAPGVPAVHAPAYAYSAPRSGMTGGSSFRSYGGGWNNSAPSYAAPHSFGGSSGAFRGGSAFSGGAHGGGGLGGGGFHGGGGFGGGHGGGGGRR